MREEIDAWSFSLDRTKLSWCILEKQLVNSNGGKKKREKKLRNSIESKKQEGGQLMIEVIGEKKKVLIALGASLFVFGVIFFLFNKGRGGEMVSPFSGNGEEGIERIEGKFLLWDDEAGFAFEHPEGLYIDDHPEDVENYAHLEITSSKESDGKILILVNDAETETIDEWVKQLKEATQASVLDTTLAYAPAKKLLFGDPKKVLTAAIDAYEGLFLLELMPGKGEYWSKAYDQILESFTFKPLTKEEQAILEKIGGGGNVVYEEEEIIE